MAAEIQAPMFPVASCDFVKDLVIRLSKYFLLKYRQQAKTDLFGCKPVDMQVGISSCECPLAKSTLQKCNSGNR